MDSNNYVAPRGNGWIVVVNGQQVNGIFSTQQAAEQAYNQARGMPGGGGGGGGQVYNTPNGPKTLDQMISELRVAGYGGPWDPGTVVEVYNRTAGGGAGGGGGGGGGGGYDWGSLWNALMGSNREQFDWEKQLANMQLYSQLAQALLGGAASLRGPYDWLKYAQYTTGGQDIFNRLWGSGVAPAFGAPTGFTEPVTIDKVLADLGLVPGGRQAAGGGPGMYWTVNGWKTIDQMRQELKVANYPNWQNAGTQEIVEVYARTTKGPVTPWSDTQTQGQAQAAGAGAQAMSAQTTPMATALQQATAPVTGQTTGATQTTRTAQTEQPLAPLPHQIHPAVWDSLSQTAKQMILAAAEEGKTPSGAWTAEDFLQQMYAARPKGTAPRQVTFNWGMPRSYF
jgi:hypothetical protein